MPKHKKSFFERLTGSVNARDEETSLPVDVTGAEDKKGDWMNEEDDAQLTVDVFQTPDEIIVQSIIAGVKADDLDIDITREMITIRGVRERVHEESDENYFYKELYWGRFSRSILLPEEIDTDEAEAKLKDGFLTVRLPKLDKNRSAKLRVKKD